MGVITRRWLDMSRNSADSSRPTALWTGDVLFCPGQPALNATIRRSLSTQSRAASDPMLTVNVMNFVTNFLNQSHSYWESCRFLLKERAVKFKKIFDPTVFNGKHGDIIAL